MDKGVDSDYKVKLAFDANSHATNYILVGSTNPYILALRNAFEKGLFRFKNQECKSAFFEMLKYQVLN